VGSYIGVADFNQDGILDIYISGHVLGPAWFDIYLGAGDGRFGFYQRYTTNGFANFAGLPAIGDFTGNGKLDLIVPENNPTTVSSILATETERSSHRISWEASSPH